MWLRFSISHLSPRRRVISFLRPPGIQTVRGRVLGAGGVGKTRPGIPPVLRALWRRLIGVAQK